MTPKEIIDFSVACFQLTDDRPEWLKNKVRRPDSFKYYRFFFEYARAIKPKVYLSLGCNQGTDSYHVKVASPLTKVVTVDIVKNPDVVAELDSHGIFFVHSNSHLAIHAVPNEIDVLFVDSLHRAEHVKQEVRLYLPKMNPGGIIFFDDVLLKNSDMPDFWEWLKIEYGKEHQVFELKHLHQCAGFGALIV